MNWIWAAIATALAIIGVSFYFALLAEADKRKEIIQRHAEATSSSIPNRVVADSHPTSQAENEFGTDQCLTCHRECEPSFIFCTDLDNTLIGIRDKEEMDKYLREFNELWCSQFATRGGILVYATGRSLKKYKMAVADNPALMRPDILICQDGVVLRPFNRALEDKMGVSEQEWDEFVNTGWDQEFGEMIHAEYIETHTMLPVPHGWTSTISPETLKFTSTFS